MTGESGATENENAPKEFSIVRKGYDPVEVDAYLAEYDIALGELENFAARLKRELHEAKREIIRLKAAEHESVEQAMAAVFDAKERIIDRAMAKAKEIEDRARGKAGLSVDPVSETGHTAPAPGAAADPAAPAASSDTVAPAAEVHPDDVLHKMLQEAETIRGRLDEGLAAAFGHMEQLQHDAEIRAADMLAEARREAALLRAAAAEALAPDPETRIEVDLPEASKPQPERKSRYSRNSAGLPRIGEDGESSVLESMNDLRDKFKETEEAAQ